MLSYCKTNVFFRRSVAAETPSKKMDMRSEEQKIVHGRSLSQSQSSAMTSGASAFSSHRNGSDAISKCRGNVGYSFHTLLTI